MKALKSAQKGMRLIVFERHVCAAYKADDKIINGGGGGGGGGGVVQFIPTHKQNRLEH